MLAGPIPRRKLQSSTALLNQMASQYPFLPFLSGGQLLKARRLATKVEFHAGKMFPCVGFTVIRELPTQKVVRVCNKRGAAEQ
jgi:hypothetical protein